MMSGVVVRRLVPLVYARQEKMRLTIAKRVGRIETSIASDRQFEVPRVEFVHRRKLLVRVQPVHKLAASNQLTPVAGRFTP